MKFVYICSFLLALIAKENLAYEACSETIEYSSTILDIPCSNRDVGINFPNYEDSNKYYRCINFGQPKEFTCPKGYYFAYVFQKCFDCGKFIPPPTCEYLAERTDVICETTTTNTKAPGASGPTDPASTITTTPTTTTTTKSTTTSTPKSTTTTTKATTTTTESTVPSTTKTTTTKSTTAKPIPSPPSETTTKPGNPSFTPPIVVTAGTNIPTPQSPPAQPPLVSDGPPYAPAPKS